MSHASSLRRFESRPAEELHDGTLAGGFVFISHVKIFQPMASCQLVAAGPAEEVLESVLLMLGTRDPGRELRVDVLDVYPAMSRVFPRHCGSDLRLPPLSYQDWPGSPLGRGTGN